MLSTNALGRYQSVLMMLSYWSLILYVFVLQKLGSSISSFQNLRFNLKKVASDNVAQENASLALIGRILPSNLSSKFQVRIHDDMVEDSAHLESSEDTSVIIDASSGVMATWIFNEFLRRYTDSHISWDHRQINSSLPTSSFTLFPSDLIRFYQNPCLYGYSFAFWKWQDWSNHLDWVALNGFNLVLASSGQELIWLKTYQSLGLKNLTGFFTGQAFLPWNRMGNLKAWSGPLTEQDMQQDVQLQHQILDKLKSFGIQPVIPAFNGIVPSEFLSLFPHETFYPLRNWGHFSSKYSGLYYLMPDSPLFAVIQRTFHEFYVQEYGSISRFYSFDTFNEMSPPSEDLEFLAAYGKNVIARLKGLDSNAIWVMQGWLFKNQTFWTYDRSRAFLESIDPQHVLILDLASTTNPQFQRLDSYFGRPFVYCMIHNYGGTNGMYGKASTLNIEPHETRNNHQSMVGIGVTPEGIHNSYVMYELLMEAFSHRKPLDDLTEWFANYSQRRYGLKSEKLEASWKILGNSVYNCCSALPTLPKPFRYHGKTTLTVLPRVSHVRIGYPKWYKVHHLLEAWTQLLNASFCIDLGASTDIYNYDLIEVTRDSLEVMLDQQYLKIMAAYFKNESIEHQTEVFLQLLQDMEKVLATNKHFMLGPWLEKAKAFGADQHRNEFMARNLITLWGPEGNILDYARRTWSGLIKDYYSARWSLFFSQLKDGKKFHRKKYWKAFMTNVGLPFMLSHKTYPTEPNDDTLKVIEEVHQRWRWNFTFESDYQKFLGNGDDCLLLSGK